MARARLNPNFELEMEGEPGYQKGMGRIAHGVARKVDRMAKAIMPRGGQAVIEVKHVGPKVFVANVAHGGHLDEWGSQNNPPYAPMRRGVRAAGLRLDERPKT